MSLSATDLPDVHETLGLAAPHPAHVERFGPPLYTAHQVQEYAASLLSVAREEGRQPADLSVIDALDMAIGRIEDLLPADDPQAWKETERMLPSLKATLAAARQALPQEAHHD